MKKHTAGLALAAVTGFSVLSATPAFAMTGPYANCAAAAADGVYNIPQGDPRYSPGLDRDNDGIACENPDVVDPSPTPTPTPTPTPSPTTPPTTPNPTSTPQMSQTPRGGVDAGVPTESNSPGAGTFALAGGLVLVAAGAGTYAVRRRNGSHA